jgi:hypothetical protein
LCAVFARRPKLAGFGGGARIKINHDVQVQAEAHRQVGIPTIAATVAAACLADIHSKAPAAYFHIPPAGPDQEFVLDLNGDYSLSAASDVAPLGLSALDLVNLVDAAVPQEVYDTVATRLGSDHPLVTRAVLVKRLFDVAAQGADRAQLAEKLGAHPHDYFYTFVNAIIQREASEKWLINVSGDVSEPLLTPNEHHLLLSSLAQEMWQTSASSLRHDVVDVLVDLFTEAHSKTSKVNRQIKERVRQHSLLTTETARGIGLAFDHEDFQAFYLGESLGGLLASGRSLEVRTFLQTNLVPPATIEQAVQYLERCGVNLSVVLEMLKEVNDQEATFSFCKENCSSLLVRIAEAAGQNHGGIVLERLFLSADGLEGHRLREVDFVKCVFQPTKIDAQSLKKVIFTSCEFERLEIAEPSAMDCISFVDCRIDSLVVRSEDLQTFDPRLIRDYLVRSGASVAAGLLDSHEHMRDEDDRTRAAERFFRSFMRRTHVDESILKVKMGRNLTPVLFEEVLPALLSRHVIGEAPWAGQGVQRRFKLLAPMSDVYKSLEIAAGDFEAFLTAVGSESSHRS